MTLIFEKIWLYTGWFYLSLCLFITPTFFCKKQSFSQKLTYLAALVQITLMIQHWPFRNLDLEFYLWPGQQKIEQITFGQETVAHDLATVLPEHARGCTYWTWDTHTQYLVQRLYPRVFKKIHRDADLANCDYLISQLEPAQHLENNVMYEQSELWVYKLK